VVTMVPIMRDSITIRMNEFGSNSLLNMDKIQWGVITTLLIVNE